MWPNLRAILSRNNKKPTLKINITILQKRFNFVPIHPILR